MTETTAPLGAAHYVLGAAYVLLALLVLALALYKRAGVKRLAAQGKRLPRKQVSPVKVAVVSLIAALLAALPAAIDLWLQTGWLAWIGVAIMVLPLALCINAVVECHNTKGETAPPASHYTEAEA